MSAQQITLSLPEALYEQIKRAAERTRRTIDDVLVEALAAGAPIVDRDADPLQAALARLAHLDDAALFRAARSTMTAETRERLESLHDKQQREGLSLEEKAEEEALMALYHETVLLRAQAAVALKQRGYDVSDPDQFAPVA